ncbi:Peptidase M16 inactive domain protein [Pseudovibrio sp. Ad13]|uniref:M16 family metallopeptidase n=1 Tax=Pseudovibrio sp. Ad13 TaxID=989396 RepID=UPI0007AE4434|nr:M16 family metallopeptidase [Pseudovibrio sp. Ad13]KZK87595.1 Peptidase M16 inactive domain protein [Pseudovibrio sp. Ad13]
MHVIRHLMVPALLSTGLVFSVPVYAQDAAAPQPKPALQVAQDQQSYWFPETDLKLHPRIISRQLPNGMRYLLVQSQSPKNQIEVRMAVDAGSSLEKGLEPGAAHYLEHMAFNGSTNVPEGEMVALLERAGLAFGAGTNAATTLNSTTYRLSLPSADAELLDTALFIMRETASELTLSTSAIDRERGVVASEVRGNYGPSYDALVARFDYLYPGIKQRTLLPVGTMDGIDAVDQATLRDFYESYYTPGRTTVVVTGDIDVEATEAAIQKHFADWERPANAEQLDSEEPDFGRLKVAEAPRAALFVEPSLPTVLSIYLVKPSQELIDNQQNRIQNTLRRIGISILKERLRDAALASHDTMVTAGTDYYSEDFADTVVASATVATDKWQDGFALLEQKLRQTLAYGVTQEEVDRQLVNRLNSLEVAVKAEETIPNRAIANILVRDVLNESVTTSSADDLAFFQKHFSDLKAPQVSKALLELWEGAKPNLFMTTAEAFPNAEETILSVFEESQKQPVAAFEAKSLTSFDYESFGPKGKVAQQTISSFGQIRSYTFENGVVLNFKRTDFDKGKVFVSLRTGRGIEDLPADKDGLAGFFQSAFIVGGLGKYSVADLDKVLSGTQVGVGLSFGEDGISGQYGTTPDDLKLQLQVVAAYLTDPAYRPEGQAFYQKSLKETYKNSRSSAEAVRGREFSRILHSGDKRWGAGSEEDLLERNYEELKPIISRIAQKGPIEIGIVGDLEVQTALDAVAETFGALQQSFEAPKHSYATGIEFPEAQAVSLTHEGDSDAALLQHYWKTSDDADATQSYTLQLLQGVIELRLRDKLREAMGATYSPYAFSMNSNTIKGFGYIGMSSKLKLDDVDAAETVYQDIVKELQVKGNITADELLRARQPILEAMNNAEHSNGLWFELASQAVSYPEAIQRYQNYTTILEQITPDDLVVAASDFLVPDRNVTLKILPK